MPKLFQILLLAFFLVPSRIFAIDGKDSVNSSPAPSRTRAREVRNYIRPCIYFNYYGTKPRAVKGTNHTLNSRLGDYSYAQSNLGCYVPLYTHTAFGKRDTTDVNTFHLLMTFNALTDMPKFSGLDEQHKIYKGGLGLRAIYGFGSQYVLFADISPYVVEDRFDKQQTQHVRLASSFVFNWMITPAFSMRFGGTRTFLLGNRFYLPMIGFRVGRLDSKFYFSFQFPRYTSFNFQPSPKFSFSFYSKSMGGLYNFSNGDSIYNGRDSVIQFGQFGVAHGVRFDFRTGPDFSCFVSAGFESSNHIWFYSYSFNRDNHLGPLHHFYDGRPAPVGFLNFGVTWRFGQAKKSTGNYLMYDIFDLNNTMDPGDNNSGPGNGDVTPQYDKKKEMRKVQYNDVVDLLDDSDLN
ncbi:MAG TPA: hypothetical protein VFU15_03890 [Bacteroidia bacterium]|nr:hypothetical protein [Bacteroidia bacterium]